MGRIFCLLMMAATAYGLLCGRADDMALGIMTAGGEAVSLTLTLTGGMAVWCGLTEILRQAGDVQRLGRALRKLLRPFFHGLEDDTAWNHMAANMAANMLGLGNAATPAGVEAARRLCAPELGAVGLRALSMLLVLNNSSLQWLPTTVITLRAEAGAASPADIWLPTLVASCVSTAVAAGMMLFLQRKERRHG